MKQHEFPFLCSLKGGFIQNQKPANTVIEAIRESITNSNYTKETIGTFVNMDKGNFNKFYSNSTKAVDSIVPIMKLTHSLTPLITIANQVGQEIHPEGTLAKKEQELQEALTELENLRSVIRGAVNVRENI